MTTPRPLSNTNILIVDDQLGMLETLADILEEQGGRVLRAENGAQAIRKIREQRVDIVLMDLMMPGLNGLETNQVLQRLQPQLPVILMTGYGQDPILRQADRYGILDVLQKPVDPGAVVAKLCRLAGMDKRHRCVELG